MTIAFVLGNGISRHGVPLNDINERGKIYGCNALYRDFTPDVLVSTDRPIATHIQETGYSAQHRFYTRKPIPGLGALPVPKNYFGFSSGPIAVALAALDGHRRIYLLGFDLGPTEKKGFNNLYADTEFYKKRDATPTFTGNWVRQIKQIAKDFPKASFFRVVGDTTADLSDLRSIANMAHMPVADFQNRINNTKEL